jgi:hypothetical protein
MENEFDTMLFYSVRKIMDKNALTGRYIEKMEKTLLEEALLIVNVTQRAETQFSCTLTISCSRETAEQNQTHLFDQSSHSQQTNKQTQKQLTQTKNISRHVSHRTLGEPIEQNKSLSVKI